jgi:hypothetical protein
VHDIPPLACSLDCSEPKFGKSWKTDGRTVVRMVCGDWSLALSSRLETFAVASDQ